MAACLSGDMFHSLSSTLMIPAFTQKSQKNFPVILISVSLQQLGSFFSSPSPPASGPSTVCVSLTQSQETFDAQFGPSVTTVWHRKPSPGQNGSPNKLVCAAAAAANSSWRLITQPMNSGWRFICVETQEREADGSVDHGDREQQGRGSEFLKRAAQTSEARTMVSLTTD